MLSSFLSVPLSSSLFPANTQLLRSLLSFSLLVLPSLSAVVVSPPTSRLSERVCSTKLGSTLNEVSDSVLHRDCDFDSFPSAIPELPSMCFNSSRITASSPVPTGAPDATTLTRFSFELPSRPIDSRHSRESIALLSLVTCGDLLPLVTCGDGSLKLFKSLSSICLPDESLMPEDVANKSGNVPDEWLEEGCR